MVLIIDNYDSFTYNLVQRLGEIDSSVDIQVYRNDRITLDEIEILQPSHLIISPGPCTPNEAGISVGCVQRFLGGLPILGVCLGHQSIGQATGRDRARRAADARQDRFHPPRRPRACSPGCDNPFVATRYHSLVIRPGPCGDDFDVSAWAYTQQGEREIMGGASPAIPGGRLAVPPRELSD